MNVISLFEVYRSCGGIHTYQIFIFPPIHYQFSPFMIGPLFSWSFSKTTSFVLCFIALPTSLPILFCLCYTLRDRSCSILDRSQISFALLLIAFTGSLGYLSRGSSKERQLISTDVKTWTNSAFKCRCYLRAVVCWRCELDTHAIPSVHNGALAKWRHGNKYANWKAAGLRMHVLANRRKLLIESSTSRGSLVNFSTTSSILQRGSVFTLKKTLFKLVEPNWLSWATFHDWPTDYYAGQSPTSGPRLLC